MKRIITFCTLLFCILFNPLSAQWQKVNLGLGVAGASSQVIKLSDRVLVVADNKLYSRLNTDTLWKQIHTGGFTAGSLSNIVRVKNDTIVAFSDEDLGMGYKVYISISTDKGVSWSKREAGIENLFLEDVVFVDDTMYVVNYLGGLYSSSDFGLSWREYKTLLGVTSAYKYFTKIGHRLFFIRHKAHQGDTKFTGIARSTDDGETWVNVNSNLKDTAYLTFLKAIDTVLYTSNSNGVFKSVNYGEEWERIYGLPQSQIRFLENVGDTLMVYLYNNHIYQSNDNGESWNDISEPITAELIDKSAWPQGITLQNGTVYVSTTRGVFSTNDGGVNWKTERFEGANPHILTLAGDKDRLYAGTYNFGIFSSADNGSTWTRFDNNFSGNAPAVPAIFQFTFTDSSIFAIPFGGNYFFKADRKTMQWKVMSEGFPLGGWITSLIEYKDKLFISHLTGLFYSIDGGAKWKRKDSIPGVGKSIIYADTLFTPADFGKVIYTTNGINWNTYRSSFKGNVTSFWKNDHYEIIRASYEEPGVGTQIYSMLSRDGGKTWDSLDNAVWDVYFNGTEILAAFNNGIAFSEDGGKNWVFKNEGMEEKHKNGSYQFVVMGDTIFAYDGNIIYKDRLRNYIVSVQETEEKIDYYFYSFPPYPIPSGDKVNIKVYWGPDVELSESSIEIYTMLGERVSTPQTISIAKQSEWHGIITWDCRTMQAGAYVMKVRHGATTSAIKIILAR
jgi:photosystem II stability/assembly factor-like uncharacterized protein